MPNADGNYSPRPWQNTPIQLKRPNPSFEDARTSEALAASMGEDADSIRGRRPPIPTTLFPERFGYREEALGIDDIIALDDIYARVDFSGRQSGYGSSNYPSLNQF